MGRRPETFKCTVCGDCCTRFEVVIDPWAEDGVVHMVKDGSIGVEVWPWEARGLIPLSQSRDLGLVLLPSNLMLDSLRDQAVATSYVIANQDCPFLEDKGCSIYKDRPNVCRYFPLVLAKAGLRVSDRCPEAVSPKMRASGTRNAETLRRVYGRSVTDLVRDIHFHESVVDLLGRLELGGHVQWDWRPDPDKVLSKVQGQEWMDLLEFIIDAGLMGAKELEDLLTDVLFAEDLDEKVDLKLLTL